MKAAALVTGIAGGMIVFFAVTMMFSFVLRNVFEGIPLLDVIVGLILPVTFGLLAGIHSFRKSVWPRERKASEGRCRNCGCGLISHVNNICPECGAKI